MTNPPHSDGLIDLLTRHNIIDPDRKLTFAGHVALTSSLLLFTSIVYMLAFCLSTSWQSRWLRQEVEIPRLVQPTDLFNKQTLNPQDKQQARLVEQLNTINDLKARHCEIMSFFYKQYFIFLSLGGTAGLVSLLCILLISKKGWNDTNNALINLGITSFGVTFFSLNTTQIFQQSENLKTSQNLYSDYVGLRYDFLSAVANKELVKPDRTIIKLDDKNGGYTQLIQDTDARMKALNLVRLGFDPTPISELRNRLDSTIGAGTTVAPTTIAPSPSPKLSPGPN